MRYTKALFLSMVFALCTAEGCPSRCESQSDCESGETCRAGYDGEGHEHNWCFPDHPSGSQVEAAKRGGWKIKKITVGTSGASVEAENE